VSSRRKISEKTPNHQIGLCRKEEGYCNLNKHCNNVHLFLSSSVT